LNVIASAPAQPSGSGPSAVRTVALVATMLNPEPDPQTAAPGATQSNPPSKPSTDESPAAKPPEKPSDTSISTAPAAGEPVKARSLHKVTILVDKAGWPYQTWLAWLAAVTEFVGGICLVLGLFTRLWGLGLAATMGVAFYLTSYEQVMSTMVIGMPIDSFTRYSSQVALFVLAFGLMLTGSGGMSIDGRLVGGSGGAKSKKESSEG
jgi:uncharacterized membrane protein YphA (DoxX/SURF4 family)